MRDRYTVRFSDEECRWLESESAKKGLSVAELVRQAVQEKSANAGLEIRLSELQQDQKKMLEDLDRIGRLLAKFATQKSEVSL